MRRLAGLLVISLLGCSSGVVAEVQPTEPTEAVAPAAIPGPSEPLGPELVTRPELTAAIRAAGYEGGFVVLDPEVGLIVSDPVFAERGYVPASTFKIPNSLIALETGVADSGGFTLAWDGVERWNADWNRDLDLTTAFAVSGVWFYQELARRIGSERMATWLTAADYGNADITGPIDLFWLSGAIRISPREQVEFLQRLRTGASPFAPAVVEEFFATVMVAEPRPGGQLRGKTGTASASDLADPSAAGFEGLLGWYVGVLERPERPDVTFALLVFTPEPMPASFRADRIALTDALLGELGYLASYGEPRFERGTSATLP